MRKIIAILISVLLILAITGCTAYEVKKQITNQPNSETENFVPGSNQSDVTAQVAEKQSVPDYDKEFSDRDLDSTYSSSETIDISENKEINITKEGTYVITGSGMSRIIVNAGDNDKIQIVLKDANITSDKNPILIKNADKVFLTIEGSNTILDNSTYEEDNVDAVVFSKADLTINGNGSLNVKGNYKHGIVSKDDLVIVDTNITITAPSSGLIANDVIKIKNAKITISAEKDGIKSDDEGYVYIESGEINISSNDNAIQSNAVVGIAGGKITISSQNDGINSEYCDLTGGTIDISVEDDGIHANNVLSVSGGKITISKSCEGFEGKQILISGGEMSVVASDDGMNAAGDTQGDQKDPFAVSTDALISISGGTISVNSGGDGIDSNGSLEISDGSIIVEGPENDGNGALDYNGSGKISGGEIITIGSSGMAQSLTGENQNVLAISLDAAQSGNKLSIKDSQNNTIKEIETSKKYSTIVFSSPELKENEAYTIFIDDKEVQKVDSGNYSNLKENGFGGQHPGGKFENNRDMGSPQNRF